MKELLISLVISACIVAYFATMPPVRCSDVRSIVIANAFLAGGCK